MRALFGSCSASPTHARHAQAFPLHEEVSADHKQVCRFLGTIQAAHAHHVFSTAVIKLGPFGVKYGVFGIITPCSVFLPAPPVQILSSPANHLGPRPPLLVSYCRSSLFLATTHHALDVTLKPLTDSRGGSHPSLLLLFSQSTLREKSTRLWNW